MIPIPMGKIPTDFFDFRLPPGWDLWTLALFHYNWYDILKDDCWNISVWFSKYYEWCVLNLYFSAELFFLLLDCRLFAFTLYCFAVRIWEWDGNGNEEWLSGNPIEMEKDSWEWEWSKELELTVYPVQTIAFVQNKTRTLARFCVAAS